MYGVAAMLGGGSLEDSASKPRDGDTITYYGTATSDSNSGTVSVHLSDDVTLADGEEGTSVELPCTCAVREGDTVMVTLVAAGNAIRVPTVTGVVGSGDLTREIAEGAQDTADRVIAHFWYDEDGAHVTEQEFDATTGSNILIDTDSMDVRNGTTVLSSFGATTRIGKEDAPHLNVSPNGMEMWFGDEAVDERSVSFSTDELGDFTSIVNDGGHERSSGVYFGLEQGYTQAILIRSDGTSSDDTYTRNAWADVAANGTQGQSELSLTDGNVSLSLVSEHIDDEEELDYSITSQILYATGNDVYIGPDEEDASKYIPPVDLHVNSERTTIQAGPTALSLGATSDGGSVSKATVGWSGALDSDSHTTHLTGQYLIYSGNATGNLTLSHTAADFEMIRVHYVCGNAGYSSLDVFSPNGKHFTCVGTSMANADTMQMEFAEYEVSGASINKLNGGYFNASGTSYTLVNSSASAQAQIRITRVEGFEHWETTGLSAGSGGGGASYEAGTGIDITNNMISVDTTQLSYSDLQDKPSIEAHELVGDSSLDDISVHRLTNSEIDALMALADS